jgi:hypothetical protein
MKTTTRLGLAALLVATLALFTQGTAFAADKLTPPSNNPSPASGIADTTYDGPYGTGFGTYWIAHTRFNVKKLQPKTQYIFYAASATGYDGNWLFTTDKQGQAAATFDWDAFSLPPQAPYFYEVYDMTGVLVLAGGSQ